MTHSIQSRLAFHPDLAECELEDRCLLAGGTIMPTSSFQLYNTISNAFVIPGAGSGSSATSAGNSLFPGPNFYSFSPGNSAGGFGGNGTSSASLVIFSVFS